MQHAVSTARLSVTVASDICQALPPAGASEPPLSEKEALREIGDLMAGLNKQNWLSGALLVARGPGVLLTEVGGEAGKAFHVPNNIDNGASPVANRIGRILARVRSQ